MAKSTYRVTGPRKVFGHEPGTTFERDMPEQQEQYLISVGHIAPSRAQNPDATDKTPSGKE